MNISDETTNLLLEINDFSDDFIRHNYEMSVLIEVSYRSGKKDEFEKLIFTGKYLHGLRSLLAKQATGNKSALERLENEFKLNMEKLIKYMKDITGDADDEAKKHFQDNYLSLTQTSLSNIMTLIDDLSLAKRYFNIKKSAHKRS